MKLPAHVRNQQLPSSGPMREALRHKGQFWTPLWLANAMSAWVGADNPSVLFDPAVGPGTFFAAARASGFRGRFRGYELDRGALHKGREYGLRETDFSGVMIEDFLQAPISRLFPAVISNPPYIRHHRLNAERKSELRAFARRTIGFPLDGRVGLQTYFLLKCLTLLAPGGRLAFLLPADVCEGLSAKPVWEWIAAHYRIEAVLTFTEAAAPFPRVDTNAMVFCISRNTPAPSLLWCRIAVPDGGVALRAARDGLNDRGKATTLRRTVAEAIAVGLSRPPAPSEQDGLPLSRFASVMRGIATGSNDFFFLTRKQMREAKLPKRYFIRAIGRTRDCAEGVLSPNQIEALDASGRPTWLLNLGSKPREKLPASLTVYLARGEAARLPSQALISTRKPWFRMEQRSIPPLLFAYLGRRDCRFILNQAGVVPLTGFLCVYPYDASPRAVKRLWQALNHPLTLRNLVYVAKSYGSGALKVEPRQLDGLKIPFSVLGDLKLLPREEASQLVPLKPPSPGAKRKKPRRRTQNK